MASNGTTKDNGHMTNDAFTKIQGLLEAAYANGLVHFFVEIPAAEWTACELSLTRGAAIRKWQHNHFVWRGEVVTKGSKWMVYEV